MFSDSSYKISFIFALFLHLVLAIFFFIKVTHSSSSLGLVSGNIINATAISASDFALKMSQRSINQKAPLTHKQAESMVLKSNQSITRNQVFRKPKTKLQTLLKKNLLQEQARELAELTKEKQKYKKSIAKFSEQKLQKILQEQVAAEQTQLSDISGNESPGSVSQGEVDKYKALVTQAIDSQWTKPEGTVPGDYCKLSVNIAPGGVLIDTARDVILVESSGNLALNHSAEAAVLNAVPLPVPEDPRLFNEFRKLDLIFKPEGIVGG